MKSVVTATPASEPLPRSLVVAGDLDRRLPAYWTVTYRASVRVSRGVKITAKDWTLHRVVERRKLHAGMGQRCARAGDQLLGVNVGHRGCTDVPT